MSWYDNTRGRGRGRPPHPDVLTPAEWRVLDEVREGHSNAEIAERLGVSVNTVRTHVSRMLAKLDLSDRTALAAWTGEPMEVVPGRTFGRVRALFAPLGWLGMKSAGIVLVGLLVVVLGGFAVAMESGRLTGSGGEPAPPAPTPVPTELTTPEGSSPAIVALGDLNVPSGNVIYECALQWCAVRTDGSGSSPLDGLPLAVMHVAPSPDGTQLAYFEVASDGYWLGIARSDGSEARRLAETRQVHTPVPPVWTPDAGTIYVERGPPAGANGIGGDTDILAV